MATWFILCGERSERSHHLAGLLTLAVPDAGTDILLVHIQAGAAAIQHLHVTSFAWSEDAWKIDDFPSRALCVGGRGDNRLCHARTRQDVRTKFPIGL